MALAVMTTGAAPEPSDRDQSNITSANRTFRTIKHSFCDLTCADIARRHRGVTSSRGIDTRVTISKRARTQTTSADQTSRHVRAGQVA